MSFSPTSPVPAPSPAELVAGALDELEAARGLLDELREHFAQGAPPESGALLVAHLEASLGVVGVRARAAVRAAGGPTRWVPR